jgi:O-antigen/teichoic acid export membrane protein
VTDDSGLPEGAGRRPLAIVAGNSAWNLLAFGVGISANLVTVPFVLRRLGISQFGICGLWIAIAAPLTLVGTTLGQSAAQGIARYRSRGDQVAASEFCATISAFAIVSIAGIGSFLGLIAPRIASGLFPSYAPSPHALQLTSMTLALGWMAQQMSLLMQGVHVACQSYRRIATVTALGAVGGPLLVFGIVGARPDVEGYILALALGYGLTALLWFVSIFVSFQWCLARPHVYPQMTKSIAAFTGWQMLAQLIANMAGQVDRYLLGAWVSANAVGYYNVSQRLEEVAYIGVIKTGDALFPQFSINAAESLARQSEIFFRASWMLNLIAGMVIAPLLAWAPSLLSVWVGAETSIFATPVLQVLTVGGMLGCAGNVFTLYALGVAKTRYTALLSATTAVTTTLASILLLRTFGFAAAGVGGVAGMLINLAVMIWLTRRHFGDHGHARRICSAIVLPIGTSLAVAALLMAVKIPIQNSWLRVIIGYAMTSLLIMFSVTLVSGVTRDGRESRADLWRLVHLPLSWVNSLSPQRRDRS